MKKIIKVFGITILLVTLIVSATLYLKDKKQDIQEEKVFEELDNIISEQNQDNNYDKEKDYSILFKQNEDMVAWLKIDGTEIDYPIMQTKDRPNYYLRRNFYKEYSYYGTPYIQENCDINTSDNLIIYGHHINNNKMFGALERYKSKSFFDEHRLITLITKEDTRKYEILYVIETSADNGFKYNKYIDFKNEEEYELFKTNCEKLSIYKIGGNSNLEYKYITLSTCDYSQKNGRLIVIARKIDNYD